MKKIAFLFLTVVLFASCNKEEVVQPKKDVVTKGLSLYGTYLQIGSIDTIPDTTWYYPKPVGYPYNDTMLYVFRQDNYDLYWDECGVIGGFYENAYSMTENTINLDDSGGDRDYFFKSDTMYMESVWVDGSHLGYVILKEI